MQSSEKSVFELQAAGGPFHDPALLVRPKNSQESLLFDCGTIHSLKTRDLLTVRWLFLSHLHIDHLIGFDHLLRLRLFSELPLTVFGPPGTTKTIGHRLLGYAWNLTSGSPFVIETTDLHRGQPCVHARFACNNQFQQELPAEPPTCSEASISLGQDLKVSWHPVNHGVACYCYKLVRSLPPKFSLETCRRLGLTPGPWVSQLINGERLHLSVEGVDRDQDWLAAHLLSQPSEQSLGYLTDSKLDAPLREALVTFFQEVDTLTSESAYRTEDADLAEKNLHMTTDQVAQLALKARVGRLLIFHLSRRYTDSGPETHLKQARSVFPATELLSEA